MTPVPAAFSPEAFELEAETLRVMANPKRLMIMAVLGSGPRTPTEISEELGLTQPNVSQHLRVMRYRRIVKAARAGKSVRYALTSPMFSRCCALVRDVIVDQTRRSVRALASPRSRSVRRPAEARAA